jgi:hypothetical protein
MRYFESLSSEELLAWLDHRIDEVMVLDGDPDEGRGHSEAASLLGLVRRENETRFPGSEENGFMAIPDHDKTVEELYARLEHVEPVVRYLFEQERDGYDCDFGVSIRVRSLRATGVGAMWRQMPWDERLSPFRGKVHGLRAPQADLIPPTQSYAERQRLKQLGYDGAEEGGDVGDEVADSTPEAEMSEEQAELVAFLEDMKGATPEELEEATKGMEDSPEVSLVSMDPAKMRDTSFECFAALMLRGRKPGEPDANGDGEVPK